MIGSEISDRSPTVKAAAILLALTATNARASLSSHTTESTLARCPGDPVHASTAGQTGCEMAATWAYDRRMNAAYEILMHSLPGPAAQRLRASQRAWLTFRNNEAAARSALYEIRQGTMFVSMQASAATAVNRDRALQLEGYVRVMAIE